MVGILEGREDMLTLHDVLATTAAAYNAEGDWKKLDEVRECASIWEDLLDAPLEDIQLTRIPEEGTRSTNTTSILVDL